MNEIEQYGKELDSILEERSELKGIHDSLEYQHDKLIERLNSDFSDKNVNDSASGMENYNYIFEKNEITKDHNKKCDEIREIKIELNQLDKLIYNYWKLGILPIKNKALYVKWKSEYRKLDDQHNFDTSASCIAEHVAHMNKEVSVSDHVKSADTTNFGYQAIFGVPVYITSI